MVMRRGFNTCSSHISVSYLVSGIERVPEQISPAVDWLRIRSVEADLVNIYAARPRVWIGQVAEGVVPIRIEGVHVGSTSLLLVFRTKRDDGGEIMLLELFSTRLGACGY